MNSKRMTANRLKISETRLDELGQMLNVAFCNALKEESFMGIDMLCDLASKAETVYEAAFIGMNVGRFIQTLQQTGIEEQMEDSDDQPMVRH